MLWELSIAFTWHLNVFGMIQGMNAYYKGGFDVKMSKREAGLILGVRSVLLSYFADI